MHFVHFHCQDNPSLLCSTYSWRECQDVLSRFLSFCGSGKFLYAKKEPLLFVYDLFFLFRTSVFCCNVWNTSPTRGGKYPHKYLDEWSSDWNQNSLNQNAESKVKSWAAQNRTLNNTTAKQILHRWNSGDGGLNVKQQIRNIFNRKFNIVIIKKKFVCDLIKVRMIVFLWIYLMFKKGSLHRCWWVTIAVFLHHPSMDRAN